MEYIIEQFLDAIAAEKAASLNTLEAYRHDLNDLALFMSEKKTSIEKADSDDLQKCSFSEIKLAADEYRLV